MRPGLSTHARPKRHSWGAILTFPFVAVIAGGRAFCAGINEDVLMPRLDYPFVRVIILIPLLPTVYKEGCEKDKGENASRWRESGFIRQELWTGSIFCVNGKYNKIFCFDKSYSRKW